MIVNTRDISSELRIHVYVLFEKYSSLYLTILILTILIKVNPRIVGGTNGCISNGSVMSTQRRA